MPTLAARRRSAREGDSRMQLLLPNDYTKGVRTVETSLRPARPACLIPDDDPKSAAKFAESRSLAWGGCASYVIPYSRSQGLSEGWRELLGILDPDRVFAVGKLPEAEEERLHEAGWFVYPRDEPEALSRESSTLLYSALEAVAKDLAPPDSKGFVVVPENPRGIVASLPLLARFGGLQEREMKEALEKRAPSYQYHLDLSELIRVERVDPQRGSSDVLAGDLLGWIAEDEVENALTLPELTLRGLRITGRTRSQRDRGAHEVEEEYRTPVVVTGNAYNSVEDFALYWNLRADHFFARPFPLWLTLDFLEEEEGQALVARTLERTGEGLASTQTRMRDLRVVSASTSAEEIEDRLRAEYPDVRIGVTNLAELFKTTCDYYHATEQSTAHFERGRASIRPPRPETFNGFVPYIDTVAYEARVDGAWYPKGKAVARSLNRMPDQSQTLVSQNGALRFVEPFTRESRAARLLDVRTPDGWSVLSSIFEERGYYIEPNAQSSASLGQLELLGGIENLKVLAISGVRKILRELSSRHGENRQYLDERKTLTFESFKDELGEEAAHDILRWLVERRVVFRGAVLDCPRCQMSAWYPIDRVQEVWRCDGCQEDSPIPLDMERTG